MKIYLSGMFEERNRLRPIRDTLWTFGHDVVSSWLDETMAPKGMDQATFFRKLGTKDLLEIASADLLILDTLNVSGRGGAAFEAGFAFGRYSRCQVWLVGPKLNPFHELFDKVFLDWNTCLEELSDG